MSLSGTGGSGQWQVGKSLIFASFSTMSTLIEIRTMQSQSHKDAGNGAVERKTRNRKRKTCYLSFSFSHFSFLFSFSFPGSDLCTKSLGYQFRTPTVPRPMMSDLHCTYVFHMSFIPFFLHISLPFVSQVADQHVSGASVCISDSKPLAESHPLELCTGLIHGEILFELRMQAQIVGLFRFSETIPYNTEGGKKIPPLHIWICQRTCNRATKFDRSY